MAATDKHVSGREALVRVLQRANGPLPTQELIDKTLKVKGVRLAGKTPKATLAAMLYVSAKKPDGLFMKTGDGRKTRFSLREQAMGANGSSRRK